MALLQSINRELAALGFQGTFKTLPEFWSWLRRAPLMFKPQTLKIQSNSPGPSTLVCTTHTFSDFVKAMTGSFGHVWLAYRQQTQSEEEGEYVYLKFSPVYQQSLLIEGILQSVAHTTLVLQGFANAVPHIHQIVNHPSYGTTLVLERISGSKLLADYLKDHLRWGVPCAENDRLLWKILIQVCTYMAILEHDIGINHRDLKGTNLLMIAPMAESTKTVALDAHQWAFKSDIQVILIDFGFSCIGKQDGSLVLGAGKMSTTTDFCPKQGRDVFLFLASLWNIEVFRKSISAEAQDLFFKWLHDKHGKSWGEWLITSGEPDLVSMYLLVGAEQFAAPNASPLVLLNDISQVAPDLVQFRQTKRPPTPIAL